MRFYYSILLTAICCFLAIGAPKPKEKPTEPEGPPTKEQSRQSINNLKQIGLAMHNHHDVHNALPTNFFDNNGKPTLSWRVAILPYVEQDELYKEFKLDEPWDSEHNKKLIEKMPKIYAPVRAKGKQGETFYQSFAGKGALMDENKRIRLIQITDGTSNTLMAVEAGTPVIWTKPDDLPFDEEKELPKLGGMFLGDFHALYCDASVRTIKKDFDPKVLKQLITIAGGEVIDEKALYPKK
jgi:hypothetical protein